MKVDKDQISAWGVHAFTGSGAILGFLALISILNNDQVGSFLWLGMALLVDGVDGTLARKVGVEEKAPNLDGIILDSIIDYLNYVINPALMIYWFQMVPSGFEIIMPALIFGISLYTFINVGYVTGVLPVTGLPIPLISHGGSNLVITLSMLGILLNISESKRSVNKKLWNHQ